jgi:hypothetical protein
MHTKDHMPTPTPGWINTLVQLLRWLRHAVLPDHSSLYGGWYTQNYAGRKFVYISVACAPRRKFRRWRPVTPEMALSFLEGLMPGAFALPAAQSIREVIAFEAPDAAGNSPMYEPVRAARIWANGRVELFVRAPIEFDENERLTVDLVGAFCPLYRLGDAVRHGAYRSLYQLPTRLRRVDWFVALSNAVQHQDRGWEEWVDLKFPGRRPRSRATNHFAAAPMHGLAWKELRSRRQRTDPVELVRSAIGELIRESGWHDGNEDALADVVAAIEPRCAKRDAPDATA